jgi:hypothetical protein
MPSSGVWRRVAVVRTEVSEECIASSIRVTRIGQLGTLAIISDFLRSVLQLLATANVVPSSPILVTLMLEARRSSETSILARATRVLVTSPLQNRDSKAEDSRMAN